MEIAMVNEAVKGNEPAQEQRVSIAVQHLNAWYGKTQALHEITLSIAPRSVTALIGPSGCGKSTFVRCLNRMHEEVPGAHAAGEVLVEGFNIYDRTIRPMHVRRHIGMVFQQPNVLPTRSIWENVAIGPRLNGTASGQALADLVERSLRQAALWDEVKDRLQTSATQLSGGQQQRLCIARAIALEPKIVLMDEPASALDPVATMQVEELIRQLKETYTVVVVTHNMQQAGRIAENTVFFLQGRIIEAGETSQIFSQPKQQETQDYITGRFS
jgi:phosphate transport system ATP-binding protein